MSDHTTTCDCPATDDSYHSGDDNCPPCTNCREVAPTADGLCVTCHNSKIRAEYQAEMGQAVSYYGAAYVVAPLYDENRSGAGEGGL